VLRVKTVDRPPEASFRRAIRADLPVVEALLTAHQLPAAGLPESIERFWLAEEQGRLIGVAGLELYGEAGLLRSVAVAPEWRGRGVAGTLVEQALELAREAGVRDIYLLTTTAEQYFPRFGFRPVSREAAPASLQASVEFREACPASAACLVRSMAGPART
jgi:amino-acid N-acetyltransferase